MRVPQKLFFRAGALFSVVLLSQCCCCIIPLPASAGQSLPILGPLMDSLQNILAGQPWAVELTVNLLAKPVTAFFIP
jgi:hypothetical protein